MKKRKKFSEHRPGCQHWHWSIFCLPSFHVDVSKHNGLFGGSNKMQLVSDQSQMFSDAQDSLWLGKVLAGKSCLSSPFCLFLQASIFPFFFFLALPFLMQQYPTQAQKPKNEALCRISHLRLPACHMKNEYECCLWREQEWSAGAD